MSSGVIYSARARQDLRNIYEYISYDLLVPETATRQTRRSLDEMPMRHRLYDDEPWHSQGVRFFPVDNYLVFYLPDETKNTVYIVRIIYSGRDIKKQLSETTLE